MSHTRYCGETKRLKTRKPATAAVEARTSRSGLLGSRRNRSQTASTAAIWSNEVTDASASGSEPSRSRVAAPVAPRTTVAS